MATPHKLSVVIITFNEERNLKRCLDSVKTIADEIVVVDSFSTDQTKAIATSYPVKWLEHSFEGHIEQKNYALQQATHNLVLSLDADECLTEALQKEILQIKQQPKADGYVFSRLTNYCGKWIRHCGWYPDKKLRLWNKEKGQWGGTNPHDKVIMQPGSIIQEVKLDLLHYSYYSISDHLKQIDYFTTIAADAEYKKGKRSSLLKIIFSPLVKFNKGYFFQAGFLDGYYGFVVCALSAHATLYKYLKINALQKQS